MASSKEKPTKNVVKTSAAAKTPMVAAQSETPLYEKERAQFKALLLGNPNYFGNLKESPFKPVLKIEGNRTYEEIGCVGFQPQFNRLEAVVFVKQQSGYGGGLCSDGTQEGCVTVARFAGT